MLPFLDRMLKAPAAKLKIKIGLYQNLKLLIKGCYQENKK